MVSRVAALTGERSVVPGALRNQCSLLTQIIGFGLKLLYVNSTHSKGTREHNSAHRKQTIMMKQTYIIIVKSYKAHASIGSAHTI